MVDYVITRTSPDELKHFGIKGQKWGIRRFQNPDGTLTEEGKQRYRSSKEQLALTDAAKKSIRLKPRKPGNWSDKESHRLYSVVNKLKQHPVVQDAAKRASSAYKEYNKAEQSYWDGVDDFYNNKKVYEKYIRKATDHYMKEFGSKNGSTWKQAYDFLKYEDGDQGYNSSVELYKRSPEGKKLADLEKKSNEARKKYTDTCKNYVSEYMGSYGQEKVTYLDGYERTVNDRLADLVQAVAYENKYWR